MSANITERMLLRFINELHQWGRWSLIQARSHMKKTYEGPERRAQLYLERK